MGQHLLDVRTAPVRRLPSRRLAIAAVAIAATVAGGAAAAHLLAGSGNNSPTHGAAKATSPQLPGIAPQALARFNIVLRTPNGHGAARITADQARHVALPLGEGPQSDGWSITGAPVLAFVEYQAGTTARTCLCWAVELNSARGIPCDGGAAGCENHHLVELIAASDGGRWLSVSGNGLG